MKSMLNIVVLCTFSIVAVSGQDYEEWIQAVDVLGDSVTFNCSDYPVHPEETDEIAWNQTIPAGWTISGWMLPSLQIINTTYSSDTYEVINGGFQLQINNISTQQFGIYHCMLMTTENEYFMIKWGLNVRGPYFESVWDKYETNVIIAFSAMGGFLLLAAFFSLVYIFRWTGEEGWDSTDEDEVRARAFGTYKRDNVSQKSTPSLYDQVQIEKSSAAIAVSNSSDINLVQRHNGVTSDFTYANPVWDERL